MHPNNAKKMVENNNILSKLNNFKLLFLFTLLPFLCDFLQKNVKFYKKYGILYGFFEKFASLFKIFKFIKTCTRWG